MDSNSMTLVITFLTLLAALIAPTAQTYFSYLYRKTGQDLSDLKTALQGNSALSKQYQELQELYELKYLLTTKKKETQRLFWPQKLSSKFLAFIGLVAIVPAFLLLYGCLILSYVPNSQELQGQLGLLAAILGTVIIGIFCYTCIKEKEWNDITVPKNGYTADIEYNGFSKSIAIGTPEFRSMYPYLGIAFGKEVFICELTLASNTYIYKEIHHRPMTMVEIEWLRSLNYLGFKREKNLSKYKEKPTYYIPYHIKSEEHSSHTEYHMVIENPIQN